MFVFKFSAASGHFHLEYGIIHCNGNKYALSAIEPHCNNIKDNKNEMKGEEREVNKKKCYIPILAMSFFRDGALCLMITGINTIMHTHKIHNSHLLKVV